MSAVDVLAVLGECVPAYGNRISHDDIEQASAAVSELIAAATRYLKARQVVSDIKEFGGPEYAYGDEWRAATVELSAAYFTFRNALIRCGGSP